MTIATSNTIPDVNLQLHGETQPHSKPAQNKEKAKLNLRTAFFRQEHLSNQ